MSSTPALTAATTSTSPSVIQAIQGWGTYNSTITVTLPKTPVAGDVIAVFFEQNRTAAFPYSGQVSWPQTATGSQWSYDGGTSSTAMLHHVVASGESGTYTLNVGGTGSGFEEYSALEVSGLNATNPLNNRSSATVAAGVTLYKSASVTPTSANTFSLAFFSPNAGGKSWTPSSGWTTAVSNTNAYSQMVAKGAVQTGTTSFTASATLSSASAYAGAADVLLFNVSGTATASSSPSPSPAPTASSAPTPSPAPTATPSGSSGYKYGGCSIYTANDWFTTNLVSGGSSYASNTVDPNSANIIANLGNSFPGLYIDAANPKGQTTVNVASSSTPMHTVSGTVMTNDPYSDDPNNQIPVTNPLYQEGGLSGSCSGDCHVIVMSSPTSPKPCVDYETYTYGSPSWNGSSYTAGSGYVHNLNHSLNSQYTQDGYAITAAGLPLLGMTDFGEDASASSINHIVEFSLPGSGASPKASGGYVAPASTGHACSSNCTNKLPIGARLRLKASYPCPSASTYPQSYRVCTQLKNYGMIFVDWNGSSGSGTSIMLLRFGTSMNGTDPWTGTDLYPGLKGITIGNFDVMTLGTIH